MPRVSYKYNLSDEDKAIAEGNGIALSTVYARLRQGWDKERAISEPPRKTGAAYGVTERNEWGEFQHSDRARGRGRTIYFPKEIDEQVDRAIANSGKSQSAFIVDLVEQCLKQA